MVARHPLPGYAQGDEPNARRAVKIRVLIVEDHPLTAEGLVAALRPDPGIEVVGVVDSGAEGVELAKELRPDVVRLDVRLQDIGAVGGVRGRRRASREVGGVIGAASEQVDSLQQAVSAGASGYLSKRARGEEIRQ